MEAGADAMSVRPKEWQMSTVSSTVPGRHMTILIHSHLIPFWEKDTTAAAHTALTAQTPWWRQEWGCLQDKRIELDTSSPGYGKTFSFSSSFYLTERGRIRFQQINISNFLVETQSVQSAPAGDKLTPYPADFIKWWNVRCRFYVTAHAVQQSSDADFYPYTQSTASMILI